jgi:Putative zinc-finger
MSCENVQERISLLLDCNLPAAEREYVLAHLDACGKCGERFESMQYMRASLRDMARPFVPAALAMKLRVMASHECARRIARKNLTTRLAHWVTATRLAFDNMMRPFAVPVTGGVLSAFVAFSFLVPSLSFRHIHSYEPPLAVAETDVQWGDPDGKLLGANPDHARLLPGSALIDGNEVSLTLLIDERGRVQDFYLSGGELTDEMKSLIMFSQFAPATVSGQPAWGLKQVVFSPRHRLRS